MKNNEILKTIGFTVLGATVGYLAVDLIEFISAKNRNQEKRSGIFQTSEKIVMDTFPNSGNSTPGPVDLSNCIPIGGGIAGQTLYQCPDGSIIMV